jgi:hypothetical protein
MMKAQLLDGLHINNMINGRESFQAAIDLYRPRARSLSAKLVQIIADRGVSGSQRGGSPTVLI